MWQQFGVTIPSATNSTYTIATIRDSDAGNYDVIVSSVGGSVTSSVVSLTVTHPPVFVSQPQSETVIQGQNASFSVTHERHDAVYTSGGRIQRTLAERPTTPTH